MQNNQNKKNSLMKVSVIVPFFNTEYSLIKECLESIYNQTYRNLEVIIVDDGSDERYVDDLNRLLREFLGSDIGQPHVFHKKSGGVSSARNYGIAKSTGDLICFVDSDDIVDEEFVYILYQQIENSDALVSSCELNKFKNISDICKFNKYNSIAIYEDVEVWRNVNSGYCVTKMYHRSIFEKVLFDENVCMCEDALFVNQVFDFVKKCSKSERVLYYYRSNPKSSSQLANAEKYLQAINVSKQIQNLEVYKNYPDVRENMIRFEGYWYFKYMVALCGEKKTYDIIKECQMRFRNEIYPYITNGNPWLKLAKILVPLPSFMFYLSLKSCSFIMKYLR